MQATKIGSLMLSMTLCLASGAFAQGGTGRGQGARWGGRMYDPKSVETVDGQVLSVEQVHGAGWGQGRGSGGAGYGVHVLLKSDKEEIAVHVGPGWYLDKHGLKIVAGDRLEVRGSRITFGGKPAIIAAQVKKGDQSLTLRDDNGLPVWRGRGRK
jgi:hypothetical protein